MGGLEGKKILVSMTNATNRIIVKNQLEQWKLIPVLASSGKEAMEALSNDPILTLSWPIWRCRK